MSLIFSTSRSGPITILLPDLFSDCKFDLRIDRNHKQASVESKQWFINGIPDLDDTSRRSLHGLKAGRLAAMCYPNIGYPQLRVCADYFNWIFHIDNLSDDMTDRSIDKVAEVVMNSLYHPYTYRSPARLNRMTRDLCKRISQTASLGTVRRFVEGVDRFFQAVLKEACDRANGTVLDIVSYIALRRGTVGCEPCWALIEYVNHLQVPDGVMNHPSIQRLTQAASDTIMYHNDIVSYDFEQRRGHMHNIIDVVMKERELALQDAVDVVGEFCKRAIDEFTHERASMPSWEPAIDSQVRMFIRGVEHVIAGNLHWSFDTERYFGKAGRRVKETRLLTLHSKLVGIRPVLDRKYDNSLV